MKWTLVASLKFFFNSSGYMTERSHPAIYCPRFQAYHFGCSFIGLKFRAYFCPGGRNVPQIQGRLMHEGHRHAPDSGQTFALWKRQMWFPTRGVYKLSVVQDA